MQVRVQNFTLPENSVHKNMWQLSICALTDNNDFCIELATLSGHVLESDMQMLLFTPNKNITEHVSDIAKKQVIFEWRTLETGSGEKNGK